MDADLKERWLEALRSGRYQQSTGRLRASYGYCCLGVLADVIDHDRWSLHPSGVYYWGVVHDYISSTEGSAVPGLSMDDQRALAKINDDADDFGPSIAYIEQEL